MTLDPCRVSMQLALKSRDCDSEATDEMEELAPESLETDMELKLHVMGSKAIYTQCGATDEDSQKTLIMGESGEEEATSSGNTLRDQYWEVVREQQKLIRKKNPDLAPKEVLRRAREASFGCNVRSVAQP